VPFGVWVVHRRRAARALIRDGVLVEGAPGQRAVWFQVGGREQRAVVRARGRGARRVLCAPGAARCLLFSDGGEAIPARVARDVTIGRDGARLSVTVRRGRTETVTMWILALVIVEMAYIALRLTFFQQPAELRCDRAKDQCLLSGSDIFGGSWTTRFPASSMTGSEVQPHESGELAWVVHRGPSGDVALGAPTGRA